jgi:FKBP-type peptidyl-prolyl cis-trans isomerase SlyD
MDVIGPNAHVVLDYTLRLAEGGEVVDASEGEDGEPITYVHGYGMLVPGLEAALAGLRAGETRTVPLSAEDAFGEHDDELLLEIDRGDFPPEVAVGDEFVAQGEEDDEEFLRVVEVRPDAVVVDGNHPLAGMAIVYDVQVREVRAATDEEVKAAAAAFEEAGYGDEAEAEAEAARAELVQVTTKKALN